MVICGMHLAFMGCMTEIRYKYLNRRPVYKDNNSQPMKWLLAILVFILGMCVTGNELFGSIW